MNPYINYYFNKYDIYKIFKHFYTDIFPHNFDYITCYYGINKIIREVSI